MSQECGAWQISGGVTGAVSTSCCVLFDCCRNSAQVRGIKGADIISALLQFVAKEMAGRVPHYSEPDAIALAHFWLTADEASRAAAHVVLSSRLSRTDAATRHAIIQEWRARLRASQSPQPGKGSGDGPAEAAGAAAASEEGFSAEEGPAVVVLAVIGAHFQEALDDDTAGRVANVLARAVASSNLLHARVASHLLSRGASLWSRHIKHGAVALFRALYARYWRYQDFNTTLSDAEAALRALAPALPAEFVEVLGEEASRHSQLVCHVRR